MNCDSTVTGPINLGNPSELTMLALAKKILYLTKSASELEYSPLPSDDPLMRKPDITLAERQLCWAPHTTLDFGLTKTIEYFQCLAESRNFSARKEVLV